MLHAKQVISSKAVKTTAIFTSTTLPIVVQSGVFRNISKIKRSNRCISVISHPISGRNRSSSSKNGGALSNLSSSTALSHYEDAYYDNSADDLTESTEQKVTVNDVSKLDEEFSSIFSAPPSPPLSTKKETRSSALDEEFSSIFSDPPSPSPSSSPKKESQSNELDEEFSSIFPTPPLPSLSSAPKTEITSNHQHDTIPLEYQRPENANVLFDSIAPHKDLTLLSKMTQRLVHITSVFIDSHPINDEANSNKKTKEVLLFQKEYRRKFKKHLHRHLHQINWVEPVLLNFFFAKGWNAGSLLQHLRLLAGNRTYAPYQNRLHLEKHTAILQQAREVSMEQFLSWSSGGGKGNKKNDSTLNLRMHATKSSKQLHDEAEDMANLLADRLPYSLHTRLLEFLEKYAEGEENVMKRNFLPKIRQVAKSHIHLFAVELAQFLGIQNIPYTSSVDPSSQNCSDPKIQEAWNQWNLKREHSCQVFLIAQKLLVEHYNSISFIKEEEQHNLSEESRTLLESPSTKELFGKRNSENPFQEMASTIDILENFSPSSADAEFKQKASSSQADQAQKNHLAYDVVTPNTKAPPATSSPNIIFIDNLPYDITQHELFEIYSRCGSISSIQLHNPNAIYDMSSPSNIIPKKFTVAKTNQSTDVYASIQFSDEAGYKTATDPHLTIFGIILRKHILRSIPCKKMKTIYLSNIPSGFFEMDIQDIVEKLTQMNIFHKDNWNKSQDADYNFKRSNQNDVTSIELNFPDFATANMAFDKFAQAADAMNGNKSFGRTDDIDAVLRDHEGISWDVTWISPTP